MFRAPIGLYRARIGWLLGRRFLCVTHTGRKSGLPRKAVVEVVHYDAAKPAAYVVAAWGERCDWYRNVMATPAVEVRIGAQCWPHPQHRLLDTGETLELLQTYRACHPRAWKRVAPILGFPPELDSPEAHRELAKVRALMFWPDTAGQSTS